MSSILRLTEYPNAEIVEKMSRHKWVYPEQRDMLYAYYESIKHGKVQISYKAKKQDEKELGRLYSTKPHIMSCTSMWNRCRSTLFADTEMDIDMVNAHPKILLAMCQKHPDHFPEEQIKMLTKYCSNRDAMFDEIFIDDHVIDEYNEKNKETKTKKDLLKTLFTIILYGGSSATWEKDFQLNPDDYELSSDFETLQFELQYIAATIVDIHPKRKIAKAMYAEKVKRKIGRKLYESKSDGEERIKTPKPHKILSYLLQDSEREIVIEAIEKVKKAGFTVTCYSYDGFQILKNDKIYEFLENINDPLLGSEFIVKPFRDPLPLDNEYLIDPEPESFNATTLWRIGLKQSFDIESNKFQIAPTTFQDMLLKKEYFEKYVFYCENQKKVIESMSSGDYNYMTLSQFHDHFINVEYVDSKGNRKPFTKWWFKHLERRGYQKMECLPPPCVIPKNVFNLWKGFEIEEYEFIENTDISVILEHFKNIAGREDVVYEYLLNWYAWKVQKPGIKTEVAIIMYSQKEGSGKGAMAEEIFKAFLGRHQNEYFQVLDSIADITKRFNNIGQNLIGVVNEARGSDAFNIIDNIKSFITQKTFNKEIKGCTQEKGLRSLCDIILTTNNDNCMKVSDSDRRWVIVETNEDVVGDAKYFKKLWKTLDDKRTMRAFFQFLKDRDLSDFNPQLDKPETGIYKEFAKSSLSPIQMFWAEEYEMWNDGDKEEEVEKTPVGDYWEKFQLFYARDYPNKQHQYTKTSFSKASRRIEGIWKDTVAQFINGKTYKVLSIHWKEMEELYKRTL